MWINRLVKEGKIPSNEKGRIPFEAGLEAFQSSQAPGYDANREHGKRQRKKKKSTPEPSPVPDNKMSVARINEQYNKARLAEKVADAKLKELKYKEAEGQLIHINDVRADAMKTAGEIRAQLFSLPAQISARCEGKSARQIEKIITEGINEVLTALQNSRFSHGDA